ncbi:hypothetical protein CN645_12780 [Burkholderia sp. IDO3]|nr:hypothetical protein DCN14_24970 [Burkholderia sp. IDO3]PCD61633.1 hypothetical protein CN645_12780 [Burkholderia sp. IDO3]
MLLKPPQSFFQLTFDSIYIYITIFTIPNPQPELREFDAHKLAIEIEVHRPSHFLLVAGPLKSHHISQ